MTRLRRNEGAALLLAFGLAGACLAMEGSLLPLAVGTKRYYKTQQNDSITLNGPAGKQSFPIEFSGDILEHVTGTNDALFGAPVTIVETRTSVTNAQGQSRSTTVTSYYSSRADGIFATGVKTAGTEGAASDQLRKYEPPLLWLKQPLQAGASWEVGKVKIESIEAPTTAQVAAVEDVTVPAGTYRGCFKVVYRHTMLSGEVNLRAAKAKVESGQGTTTVWLAPGIGSVKETAELTGVYVIRPTGQEGIEVKADVSSKRTRELTKVEMPA